MIRYVLLPSGAIYDTATNAVHVAPADYAVMYSHILGETGRHDCTGPVCYECAMEQAAKDHGKAAP